MEKIKKRKSTFWFIFDAKSTFYIVYFELTFFFGVYLSFLP